MKPWSHLPNAHLIDWVLESLKTNPDSWNAAYDAARKATYAAWTETWDADRDVAYDAAINAAREAAYTAAYNAARNSLLALIAYDDCRQYLDMTYEQLLTYAILSEKPAAVLLLPLKWIQEQQSVMA